MRLLRVELARFVLRRGVAVVLLLAALVTVLLAVSAAYETRPADDTERAAAEQLLLREGALADEEYAACRGEAASQGTEESACERAAPELAWFLPRSALDLDAQVDGRGLVLVVTLAGAAVLLGAASTGPDWSSGSMRNQLLQVPRRSALWTAKALAVVLATTAASAVLLGAFWGSLYGVAATRDLTPTSETWSTVLGSAGRGLVLVAAVALGSYALTMLLRHTVATLGLLFAYVVVGEGLAASLPFERMGQWSLARNVHAFVRDGIVVRDQSLCSVGERGCVPRYELTGGHAAAYLGALLLVAVVASVLAFRHRDVP